MCFGDGVELLELEFFARVLLVFVVESCVVHMTLPDTVFVAF